MLEGGRATPAAIADHIQPVEKAEKYDLENLQSESVSNKKQKGLLGLQSRRWGQNL